MSDFITHLFYSIVHLHFILQVSALLSSNTQIMHQTEESLYSVNLLGHLKFICPLLSMLGVEDQISLILFH